MIRVLTGAAFQIDAWLHRRLGRAYRMMLSVGLVVDIVHRIIEAPEHVETRPHLTGIILAVAMELALLLHQVGELHHRLGPDAQADDQGERT
jgi:hypothetical protein